MKKLFPILILLVVALIAVLSVRHKASANSVSSNQPVYTAEGKLVLPASYRDWTFLTSGFGMNYSNGESSNPMFTNVFVTPEALQGFKASGKWPDKSMFIVEIYSPASKGSINKSGKYQTNDIMARSIHIKDESRFPGKWAFFGYDDDLKPSQQIPTTAVCYSCHEQHGAVDTTFVQFYPTLLEIAKKKYTLSAAYVKEEAGK